MLRRYTATSGREVIDLRTLSAGGRGPAAERLT